MFEFIRNYVKSGLKIIFYLKMCSCYDKGLTQHSVALKRSLRVHCVNLTIVKKFTLFLDN